MGKKRKRLFGQEIEASMERKRGLKIVIVGRRFSASCEPRLRMRQLLRSLVQYRIPNKI